MLDEKCTYDELKTWFLQTELPQTCDSEERYYMNVPGTVGIYMEIIEKEIEKHGSKVKKSIIARDYKRKLFKLYVALQEKANWNKPQPTWDDIITDKR